MDTFMLYPDFVLGYDFLFLSFLKLKIIIENNSSICSGLTDLNYWNMHRIVIVHVFTFCGFNFVHIILRKVNNIVFIILIINLVINPNY